MTVNNDNIIIDNDSNSSIDGLDNKSLENEKRNKSTYIAMIILNQILMSYAIFILRASIYQS